MLQKKRTFESKHTHKSHDTSPHDAASMDPLKVGLFVSTVTCALSTAMACGLALHYTEEMERIETLAGRLHMDNNQARELQRECVKQTGTMAVHTRQLKQAFDKYTLSLNDEAHLLRDVLRQTHSEAMLAASASRPRRNSASK